MNVAYSEGLASNSGGSWSLGSRRVTGGGVVVRERAELEASEASSCRRLTVSRSSLTSCWSSALLTIDPTARPSGSGRFGRQQQELERGRSERYDLCSY